MTTLKRSCMASLVFLLMVSSGFGCSLPNLLGFIPPLSTALEQRTSNADAQPSSICTPPLATSASVSSSNPIIYSGFYLNNVTGEQGDIALRIEHVIDIGNGQIAFGGKLIGGGIQNNISGTFLPNSSKIVFSPGSQLQFSWIGIIQGEAISGKIHANGQEQGVWQVKHSEGQNFQQVEKAYGGSGLPILEGASCITSASTRTVPDDSPRPVHSEPVRSKKPIHSVPVGPRDPIAVPIPLGPKYPVPQIVPAGPRYPIESVPVGPRYPVPITVPLGPRY